MATRTAIKTEVDLRNLYRRSDVRDELQILRRRFKARLDKHQRDAGDGPEAPPKLFAGTHIPMMCKECWQLTGAIDAVAEAIRMFGGREPGEKGPQMPVERSEASG